MFWLTEGEIQDSFQSNFSFFISILRNTKNLKQNYLNEKCNQAADFSCPSGIDYTDYDYSYDYSDASFFNITDSDFPDYSRIKNDPDAKGVHLVLKVSEIFLLTLSRIQGTFYCILSRNFGILELQIQRSLMIRV